jgi:hypothetical protein
MSPIPVTVGLVYCLGYRLGSGFKTVGAKKISHICNVQTGRGIQLPPISCIPVFLCGVKAAVT